MARSWELVSTELSTQKKHILIRNARGKKYKAAKRWSLVGTDNQTWNFVDPRIKLQPLSVSLSETHKTQLGLLQSALENLK